MKTDAIRDAAEVPDFALVFASEPRQPQAVKTVQWTVLSGERRAFAWCWTPAL